MSDERKDGKPEDTEAKEAAGPQRGAPGTGRGGSSRFFLVLSVILGLLLAGVVAFYNIPAFHVLLHPHAGGDNAATTADKYTCGMHPFIITDKPGNCPICGMALTKIEGSATPSGDEVKGSGAGVAPPEGYATVQVGMERAQMAGIQSATAVREAISHPVRAVGIVVPDERRVRRIQSKVEGWVEKLHTNFVGQMVTKGQPLLEIYSPDLVATQREYLLARAGVDRMKESPYEDAREMSSGLAQAARTRLKLFDVPESSIEELERTGKVRRTVTLNAPVSGYVTGKDVFEGTRVMPGMDLLTVTDLSRVWIDADLYEYEAQAVRVGQTATLETVADPGGKLKGRVAFIYPTFSPETRTLKVRFDFPNPGLRLKPQMYANVALDLHSVTGVVVPDSALIETGVRVIAFVDSGAGSFEPREVKVGVRGGGKAQILSGVKAGEKVAVGANFLLDSESKLRAALTKMTGGASAPPPTQPQTTPSPKPQPPPKPQPQGQVDHTGHGGGR